MSGDDSDSEFEYDDLKEEGKLVVQIKPTDEKAEVTVKLRRDMPFQKVFKAFESQVGVDEGTYKYLYGPDRIYGNITPKMLEMKTGRRYIIEATLEQLGGLGR